MPDVYQNYTSTSVLHNVDEERFTKRRIAFFNQNILRHIPRDRELAILDCGCGYGSYLKALRDNGYLNVTGIDISEEQIDYAREKLGMTRVFHADAFAFLAEKPSAFAVILLLDVLEHLETEKSIELVELARRALSKGGALILQVPNGLSPFSINYWGDITHRRAYSIKSMEQTLLMGGFRRFEHYSCPPPVCSAKSFLLSISWNALISPLIKCFFYAAVGTAAGGIYTPNLLSVAHKDEEN